MIMGLEGGQEKKREKEGKQHPKNISFSDEGTNTEAVLREATMKIHAKYDFFETTLQIEVYEKEMEDCIKCTNPE
jgi:hypothetical protein